MTTSNPPSPAAPPRVAIIFDLDGVLTDTAELHYQSWQSLADELQIPFDRDRNEALRGVGRAESLALVLGDRAGEFSAVQKAAFLDRKNSDYLDRVSRMTPDDLLPGALALLRELRRRGAALAVASSSRNARAVLDRLGVGAMFDAVVDGNDAPRSKPDPQVFLAAAERLGVPAERCVIVEDAESGVAAARAAGMAVAGIGPASRVGAADVLAPGIGQLSADSLLALCRRR